MASLFLQAEGILIWLGDELQDEAIVFALIQEFEESSTSVASASDNTSADVETFRSRVQTDNALRHAVGRLLQRAWFHRIWLIQEVAKASKAPSHLRFSNGVEDHVSADPVHKREWLCSVIRDHGLHHSWRLCDGGYQEFGGSAT
jgi:hypothetical protein